MKLSVAAFAVALVASASGAVQEKQQNFLHHSNPRPYYEDRFLTWMTEFGLTFSDSEYEARLATFAHSEDVIARNNANPAASITMAHNPFSHMTWPEFKSAKSLGRPLLKSPARPLNILPSKSEAMASSRKLADLPKEVDWHKKGGVTPVKNQEQCGSCWSYSTTGALEGAYFAKYGKLVSFSEQMLVDCDDYDSGCGGGLMDFAFHWIQENGGLCAEDDYPYTGVGGECAKKKCTRVPGSQITGWQDVGNTKEDLMLAVYAQPVAVAIEADEMAFQFYKDGVLTAGCGTNLDHGVLLTGYGTTENGVEYWMIKNSWGPEWGNEGYIKLLRGAPQKGGECGILMQASYPVLA